MAKLVDLDYIYKGNRLNNKLRDTVTTLDIDRTILVGIECDNTQLATITAIDKTGSIHNREPMLKGKATPRLHKTRITLRNCDGNAGWNKSTASRFNDHIYC